MEEPISEFVDRTGLMSDKEFFLTALNEIDKRIKDFKESKIELNISVSGKDIQGTLEKLKKTQDELTASVNDHKKALDQLAAIQAKGNGLNEEAARSLTEQKEAIKQRNSELQNEVKLRQMAEGSINQLKAQIKQLQAAYDGLSKSQRLGQQGQDLKAQIDALSQEKAAAVDLAKVLEQADKEKQKLAAAAERELKNQEKLNSAYNQLNQKYVIAANTAKNLAAAKGIDNEETVEAIKQAQKYHQELLQIDSSVGQSQRNVGNYKSAFNGLTNAVNQITREVPNAAISMQTFFTAISNNLPILADEIGMVAARNKELAASGEKPVSVLKQLAGSIFSWQTALVAGVTILTLYGAKFAAWINNLVTGAKTLEQIQKEAFDTTDSIERLSKAISDLSEDIKALNALSKVNIQVDNTNIPQLNGLRNEMKGLEGDYISFMNLQENMQKDRNEKAGKSATVLGRFLTDASDEAKEAYFNGTIDATISKLKEKDKVLYETLKTAKKAVDDADADLKKLNNEGSLILAEQRLKRIEIIKLTGEEERKIVLENARAAAEAIKTTNSDVLANDRSTLRQRLSAIELLASAQKRITEAEKNDVLNDPTSSVADRNAAVKRAAAEQYAIEVDKSRKLIQEKEAFYVRDLTAQKEYLDKQMQQTASTNKDLSDNEQLTLEQRLTANKVYFDKQRQLIEANYKLQLQLAGLTEQQIATFQKDPTTKLTNVKKTQTELFSLAKQYESDVLQLSIDTNTSTTAILGAELKKQQDLRQENLDYIQLLYTRLNTTITTQYAQEVIALNDVFNKGGISYEKYAKKRHDIDVKYQELVGRETVNGLIDQLKIFKGSEQEKEAALKKLNDLQRQYNDAATDADRKRISEELTNAKAEYNIAKDNVEKKIALENQLAKAQLEASDKVTAKLKRNKDEQLDHLKKLFAQIEQVARQLDQVVFGALNNSVENQKAAIQNQMDLLDIRTRKEIEAVDQSLDSQENKQKKEAEINARAAAQKDHLERLQKEQDFKKAQYAKAQAITEIILNTARAVVEALPNIPLSVAIGAIGAAELGIAVAQRIPRYYKGKDTADNYEGLAVVGDGGKREAIVRESGKVEITPAKDTLTYVGKNDIILPDASMLLDMQMAATKRQTDKILSYSELLKIADNSKDLQEIKGTLKSGFKLLNQTMKSNRPIIYQPSNSRSIIMGTGSDRPDYYNKNLQG